MPEHRHQRQRRHREGARSSGRRTRMIQTPAQTRMNANSVPMLVISPTMLSGRNAGERGREHEEQHVRLPRRLELRVHLGEDLRHQTVVAHRVEHARLPHQHHEDDRREAGQNRDRHELGQPRVADHVLRDREGHRGFLARGAEVLDRRHAAQHVREQHVEDGADDQRAEDADRHVALRVLGFLRRRRHRVEADEREEHDAGRAQDAHDAAVGVRDPLRRRVGRRRRNVRRVVRRVHEAPADHDHHQDDRHLGDDDEAVDRSPTPACRG